MKKRLFNRALRLLLFTSGLANISAAMFIPIYAIFVEEVGGTILQAAIAGGLFALSSGLTMLFISKYEDKIRNYRGVVIFGYVILAIGFLLYILVDSINFLYVVQVLVGFANAIYRPAFDALYSKHVAKTKMAEEWGGWEAMNYFALFAGAVVGGFIVNYYGFNVLFGLMGGLCILSALIMRWYSKVIK